MVGKAGGMMSNSKDKMDVIVTKNMPWGDDKDWVKVTLKKSRTFIPSFEDLYRIIRAICHCEEEKYPNGKGLDMVAEFLEDCCRTDDWDYIVRKYQIPERGGSDNDGNGKFRFG